MPSPMLPLPAPAELAFGQGEAVYGVVFIPVVLGLLGTVQTIVIIAQHAAAVADGVVVVADPGFGVGEGFNAVEFVVADVGILVVDAMMVVLVLAA